MAVVSCDMKNVSSEEDENGYITYTALYQVITDSRMDGPATVRSYATLPGRGTTYAITGGEGDGSAFWVGRSIVLASAEDSNKKWNASVRFSNNPKQQSDKDDDKPPEDPLDEPPVIETFAIRGREGVLFTTDDKLIASSAGEPYDPVQEKDKTKYMLRITQNQATVDPVLYATYKDVINADPFFGCSIWAVKVETPGAIQRMFLGGVLKYFRVTWEFSIDTGHISRGWRRQLYDYGMYKKVGNKLEVLKDLSGHPLTSPRLLDGAGAVLAVGAKPVIIEDANQGLRIYREQNFAPLNLPQSF